VDDNVAEVEDSPPGIGRPFPAEEFDPGLAELFLELVNDGLELTLGLGRADDKIIGEHRYPPKVKNQDVACLLFRCNFCREACDLPGIWSCSYGFGQLVLRVTLRL